MSPSRFNDMTKEKTQREKFEEAARELGAAEDTDVFEAMVEKIAHSPKLSDEEIKELAKQARAAKPSKHR